MSRVVFVTYSVDGAARLARLAPQAMIYTTISNIRELDTLDRRGVDLFEEDFESVGEGYLCEVVIHEYL